jgi:hypothetical protein
MSISQPNDVELAMGADGVHRVYRTVPPYTPITVVPDWLADLMYSADSSDDFAKFVAWAMYYAEREGFIDGREDFAEEMRGMLGAAKEV